MADASTSASGAASTADPSSSSIEDKGKEVAGAELEEESVYREKELKDLQQLVHTDLKADVGCSVSGLYDLVGEYIRSISALLLSMHIN